MAKEINRILRLPLFLYIYIVCFLAYKSLIYAESFSFESFIITLLILFLSVYFITNLLTFFFDKLLASWICFFIFFEGLHIISIAKIFGYEPNYVPSKFLILMLLLTIGLFCILFTYRNKLKVIYLNKISYPINVFLSILFIVIMLNGFRSKNDFNSHVKRSSNDKLLHGFQNKPNILWLLLDEYGSSSILFKGLNYHNNLDTILSQKGFVLFPHIKTNYSSTLYSVNSILNADNNMKFDNFYQAIDMLRNASWVSQIEKQGYEFKNISYFDIGSHEKVFNRSGYPQNYIDQISSGTIISLVSDILKYTSQKCDFYNQSLLQILSKEISQASPKPKFIWSHIMMPHEPFTRDSLGRYQESQLHINSLKDSTIITRQYIGQVKYINNIIDSLLKKHSQLLNYIIVISGDHGPRYNFLKKINAGYYPYAALYFPDKTFKYSIPKVRFISDIPITIQDYLSSPRG